MAEGLRLPNSQEWRTYEEPYGSVRVGEVWTDGGRTVREATWHFAGVLVLYFVTIPCSAKPPPSAVHLPSEVHRVISAEPGSVTLYDQNDDDAGVAVLSSELDGAFANYSAAGADDFTVPAGHKWRIREVDVTGAWDNGSGPATFVNVFFYASKNRLPGSPVAQCGNLYGAEESQGSFAIKIPKSCGAVLRGGQKYWIAVSTAVEFYCCGDWTWETRNGRKGSQAAWQNPGDGFGTGCTAWAVMRSCVSAEGAGPDFMFTLKGEDSTH